MRARQILAATALAIGLLIASPHVARAKSARRDEVALVATGDEIDAGPDASMPDGGLDAGGDAALPPLDDGPGCSVAPGGRLDHAAASIMFLAGLLWRRRRS